MRDVALKMWDEVLQDWETEPKIPIKLEILQESFS